MRRRTFLLGGAAVAGGLGLGYRSWANGFDRAAVRQVQGEGEHLLAGCIKIVTDDIVTVYIPHIDMGQGAHTALAMLAAEELDADRLTQAQDRALIASEGNRLEREGDPDAALSSAPPERRVEAEYRVPYLHHAAMEPINLTAQFVDGRLTVWGGEQDALGAKARLVELSNLGADAVTFHGLAAGGSFGRRIAPSADYMEHIVPIARAVAPRPVKLILPREEEFAQGSYRPALTTRLSAALA